MSQSTEYLCKHGGLKKPRSVAHACNPGAGEAEGEELWVSLDESVSFRLSETHCFE